LFDFVQREAEILGALDEADYAHRIVGKFAIAGFAPRRLRQQAAAFVISKRLHVDAGLFGGGSDSHVGLRVDRGPAEGGHDQCDGRFR